MKTLALFIFSCIAITFVIYLISPVTVDHFYKAFASFDSSTAGLWMIYLNVAISAAAYAYVFPNTPRSEKSLLGGGLIAASSIGLSIAFLYLLPTVSEHVAARYFVVIEVLVYGFCAGIPMAIVQMREDESREPLPKSLESREFKRRVTIVISDAVLKLPQGSQDAASLKSILDSLQVGDPAITPESPILKDALACLHKHDSASAQYEQLKALISTSKN